MQDNRSLSETLEDIKKAWEQARETTYPEKKRWIQSALGNIYSLHTGWYLEKVPQEIPHWKRWLDETALPMKHCSNAILTYMNSTISHHEVQWIGEDWMSHRELCYLRSKIAFLIDTYREYLSEEAFELEPFDEQLRELSGGGAIPDEYVPDGVPDTHWWWFPGETAKLDR